MKILVAETAGFCWGVRRALDQALDLTKTLDGPLHTFGPLIHNAQVIDELAAQNIHTRERIEDVRDGTILVRAHGVRPEVFEQLRSTGAEVYDATCPLVRKVQKIISKYTDQGYEVVIVGDDHHAEVQGLRGYAQDRCYVVASEHEAMELPTFEKVCVVSQTTQNDQTFERVVEQVHKKSQYIRIANTICEPTRDHQTETIALAQQVDLMIVVGGRHSANTSRLASLAQEHGVPVLHVETESELHKEAFQGCQTVGVTAGASTPEWMINRVVEKLKSFNPEPASRLHTGLRQLVAGLVINRASVAVSATALCLVVVLLLKPDVMLFQLVLLMLTTGVYTLAARTLNDVARATGQQSPPARWALGAVVLIVALGLVAEFGPLPLVFLMFAGLLSMAYRHKLLPLQWARHTRGIRSLKDLPASKDMVSALEWTLVVGGLPWASLGASSSLRAVGVLAFVFVLVFTRSAFLGMRDARGDQIMGRETIFRVVGQRRTKAVFLSLTITLSVILGGLSFPWRASPLAVWLFPLVLYGWGVSWAYQRRLLPKGAEGEALVDGQFLLAGLLACGWRMYG